MSDLVSQETSLPFLVYRLSTYKNQLIVKMSTGFIQLSQCIVCKCFFFTITHIRTMGDTIYCACAAVPVLLAEATRGKKSLDVKKP